MARQFAILGVGRFGRSVAETLISLGQDVLCVDENEERVQSLSHDFEHIVVADSTDAASLKALGISSVDVAIVGIGAVQNSLLTTVALKEENVPVVLAKAQDLRHGKMLEKIGADKVIYPEKDSGQRVAHNLVSSSILDFIELSPHFGLAEISVSKVFLGKMLKDSGIRQDYSLNVVAVRNGDDIVLPPPPDRIFVENDIIMVVGNNDDIKRLEEKI